MRDLAAGNVNPEKIRHLNEQLLQVESNWLDPAGIPGRPWFQHLLYSSRYTYAHLEFPGLTEAVESANWELAAGQVNLLAAALVKNTELLRSAKSGWEKRNEGVTKVPQNSTSREETAAPNWLALQFISR